MFATLAQLKFALNLHHICTKKRKFGIKYGVFNDLVSPFSKLRFVNLEKDGAKLHSKNNILLEIRKLFNYIGEQMKKDKWFLGIPTDLNT